VGCEEVFQTFLDLYPDDHVTRLVFADWLEETGDARSTGIRLLGSTRKHPRGETYGGEAYQWYRPEFKGDKWHRSEHSWPRDTNHTLPEDWWLLLDKYSAKGYISKRYSSRAKAEDAAARAFLTLPLERQQELLQGVYT
jgi:uncharacterized protein (TIGR02996 family)